MNSKHCSQPSCMLQYLMDATAGISCEYDYFSVSQTLYKLRRNLIEDGAISGFSGQNSLPE